MLAVSQTLPLPLAVGHEATIEGRIKTIRFDSVSGDMRVFDVEDDERVVHTVRQFANGQPMCEIKKGDQVRVLGRFENHKRWGKQFSAKDVIRRTPTSAKGVAKIISGKQFKGIGPKVADKLLQEFGQELISILNRGDPGELITDMIGAKKAKALVNAWLENQAGNMTDATLAELGIGPATRTKIKKEIPDIETVLQTDPYRLAREIDGIGFLTADQLAMRAGVFKPDSPARLAVGISHALDMAGQEGHTGLSRNQLIDKSCEVLTFGDRRAIAAIMETEIRKGDLEISPNDLVQTKWTAMRESRLAKNLVALARAVPETSYDPMVLMRLLSTAQERYGLTDEQFMAVQAGVTSSLSIVTGGPGTGKTRTIKAIASVLTEAAQKSGYAINIKCIAPTGKAADRMNESTGFPASTVHMALGRDQENGGFLHKKDNPFECDVVIADEFSMMDTRLADSLILAIAAGKTRLIIVGDVNQLASVDPGRVLHDVIESGICPVTRFTVIWRTGAGSAIALGAAKINEGKMPEFGAPGKSDLVFIELDDPGEAASRIVKMASETLPSFTGLTTKDIQILSPGKNSAVGVNALNEALQDALNPGQAIVSGPNQFAAIANGHKARMGDRIICTRTDYSAEVPVFNGDVGVIDDFYIEGDEAYLRADCGKKEVFLEREYWKNVALAYALTIHKSQGSEYPIVIIPLTTSHYMMLKRNLLYTGVTRAQRMCIVVGSKRALQVALQTTDGTSRQTGLLSRIKGFAKLK